MCFSVSIIRKTVGICKSKARAFSRFCVLLRRVFAKTSEETNFFGQTKGEFFSSVCESVQLLFGTLFRFGLQF